MFVYMSDPTAPIGPLEVTSTLLTVISRSLLSLSNHCYAGSYGFGYLFDGILLSLFVSYLCRSRRVLAKATFTTDQLHTYVYRTLPAVMVSAVTTFTFLYGESYSCLQEKRSEIAFPDVCEGTEGLGEDATGVCYTKAGECDDVSAKRASPLPLPPLSPSHIVRGPRCGTAMPSSRGASSWWPLPTCSSSPSKPPCIPPRTSCASTSPWASSSK